MERIENQYDVIVIGSGIGGMTCGDRLRRIGGQLAGDRHRGEHPILPICSLA